MQKLLLYKAIAVLGLVLLIIVPISFIRDVVQERQERQAETVNDISSSYAGAQTIVGPILVVPYTNEYVEKELDEKGNVKKLTPRRIERRLLYFPRTLNIDGALDTDFKHRGLFRVLVYDWQAKVSGAFDLPAKPAFERDRDDSRVVVGHPFIIISVEDLRGLLRQPTAEVNGKPVTFEQGSNVEGLPNSIHAAIADLPIGEAKTISFSMDLALRGTEKLGVVPSADTTHVKLRSTWPHPNFGGRFLPDPRTQHISEDGFSSQWNVTSLATNAQQQLRVAAAGAKECGKTVCADELKVHLVEPVNIYTQSDRATKYGFLFVGLTFGAFFLFELMKRLAIHPAQYVLVGLALAIFFLLLVSLSEHLEFWIAYLSAASACVGLLAFYLSYVLRSTYRGIGFGCGLSVLFGALYGLLISEDNALVLGSLLLFAVLAGTMIVTRKIDWYRLSDVRAEA
ncbi:MAG TPA: cell envelope integrity protein CreD [Burkholderiales bacterium]|nr:cell envelope integrity protein CreD [Burkholderiales bacterium]